MINFKLDGNEYGYLNPYVIAEIGVNHEGSLERAKEMIDQVARAGGHAAARRPPGTPHSLLLPPPFALQASAQHFAPGSVVGRGGRGERGFPSPTQVPFTAECHPA